MIEKISVIAVAVAAILTAINQISIVMAATAATTEAIREAECWDTSKIGNSK